MSVLNRIPTKYLIYVPSVFFALLGAYDIIADQLFNGVDIGVFLFNAILFVPLVFRRWYVLLGCGVVFTVFWTYMFIVGFFLIFGRGFPTKPTHLAVLLFLFVATLLSIALYHAGARMKASLGIGHRLNGG